METNNKKGFKVGDWVKGKSYNGELIYGYIETIESFNSYVTVYVFESDNVKLKGKIVKINEKTIENQTIITDFVEGELLNLIDIALSTRDKRWFTELVGKLKRRQNSFIIIKKKEK